MTTYFYQLKTHRQPLVFPYGISIFRTADIPNVAYLSSLDLVPFRYQVPVAVYNGFTREARTLNTTQCEERGIFKFTDLGDLLQCVAAHETEESYKVLEKHLLQVEI